MRSSWNMREPTWVSRSRCWLLTGERLGHVCMSPEPVGSTHLRFDDARVIKGSLYVVTKCCSESRMRSRTSRGVPEWSGGKDLYMGSPVLVTERVSGFIGNVPGPPGGSRGSTKWDHRPRRAAWATCGRGPAPGGLVRPPPPPKGPRRLGFGGTLEGGAPPPLPWGASHPSWPPPLLRWDLRG